MKKPDKQYIQNLLEKALTDRKEAVNLFKLYKDSMFSEASLYLKDENSVKEAVLQSFRNAYPHLRETDADELNNWLNQYVQEECIRRILPFHIDDELPYTDSDEKPLRNDSIPDNPERIRKLLRSALGYLDESQRLVSVLKYRDQLSFEEIASKCNASESQVKSILSSAKQAFKSKNAKLDVIFSMINKIYPYYKEDKPKENTRAKRQPTEEEIFNTSVNELKDFFNQKGSPAGNISDREIDDSEDPNSHEIEQTFEMKTIRSIEKNGVDNTASSAKMIIAAAMAADSEDRIADQEYDPKKYKRRRIIFGIIALILIAAIAAVIAMIIHNRTDDVTNEPVPTEAAVIQESDEPEITADPEASE